MVAGSMTKDRYLDHIYPSVAHLPTTLPWRLAGWLGDKLPRQQATLKFWLASHFSRVFPLATFAQCHEWAGAHLRMLAEEKVDAMAFHRLGHNGGPTVDLQGAGLAQALAQRKQGFILVLNHFDRLLTAPVALSRLGIVTHALTMPVMNNPELDGSQRRFILQKIRRYTEATGGIWHTTDDGMRPVHDSLRSGQAWVILADAWGPHFGRMRDHAFLDGWLNLPTGIERLAKSTNVPLLQATTYTDQPHRLRVILEALPQNPREAINTVMKRLDHDVRERPWAWWHWGLWDRMWRPDSKAYSSQGDGQ